MIRMVLPSLTRAYPWMRFWQYSKLKKLINSKEDEIWNAAIWHGDGEISRILEEFEEKVYLGEAIIEPETMVFKGFHLKSEMARAINNCYDDQKTFYFETPTKFSSFFNNHMTNIADALATTSRPLTKNEMRQLQCFNSSNTDSIWNFESYKVSILWIAIHRNHVSDFEYLLKHIDVNFEKRYSRTQETLLHRAVYKRNEAIVRSILERSSSAPRSSYVDLVNSQSRTPLHTAMVAYMNSFQQGNSEESHVVLRIVDLLLEHGANINALDVTYQTPLHVLLRYATGSDDTGYLLAKLLSEGAEVNVKDFFGMSQHNLNRGITASMQISPCLYLCYALTQVPGLTPLHLACQAQNRECIQSLVEKGADLETLDPEGETPGAYFTTRDNHDGFWTSLEILTMTGIGNQKKSMSLPQRDRRISTRRMAICRETLVYCRFQSNQQVTHRDTDSYLHWIGRDLYVSDVLYPTNSRNNTTFLEECEKESERIWAIIQDQLKTIPMSPGEANRKDRQPHCDPWRWVSFPANNMTWIKDFILDHTEKIPSSSTRTAIWEFFQNNIRVRNTRQGSSRVRAPHAQMGMTLGSVRSAAYRNVSEARSMVSIAIPFLDIEMDHIRYNEDRREQGNLLFTGLDGVQMPQTLDQTFNSVEGLSGLRSKENQVIYRWSQKQALARYGQKLASQKSSWASNIRKHLYNYLGKSRRLSEPDPDSTTFHDFSDVTEGQNSNATKIQGIQKETEPKWLMVRQLWLWRLHDGTILTAIPSREGTCMADDLLETIRHSDLDVIPTSGDLMNHIVEQTVTFTERFRLAGLGEHILDIFENELASEMDREYGFFNSFTRKDWDSKFANKAINEAAGSTWRVKDIREELRLIDQVFMQQLDVLKQFAVIVAADKGIPPEERAEQEATLIRESGLEVLRERIKRMDEDAARTIDGLSNITQAMLAQASLKEAESARLMNFIILPFTVVTVIFTPLSFMTSLFAVNSDGFPHNDEGELRIPSDWLRNKMIIGEIGTLIPLLIIVVSVFYLTAGRRRTTKRQ